MTDVTCAVPAGLGMFFLPVSRHFRAGLSHSVPAALEHARCKPLATRAVLRAGRPGFLRAVPRAYYGSTSTLNMFEDVTAYPSPSSV